MTTYELVEGNLGSLGVHSEPPGISSDSSDTNIDSDNHVTEEQPFTNQGFTAVSWRNPHDAVIGRVETESGRGQTVGDKVDPKELYRDQRFRHAEQHGQEYADDFSNIRRNCSVEQGSSIIKLLKMSSNTGEMYALR